MLRRFEMYGKYYLFVPLEMTGHNGHKGAKFTSYRLTLVLAEYLLTFPPKPREATSNVLCLDLSITVVLLYVFPYSRINECHELALQVKGLTDICFGLSLPRSTYSTFYDADYVELASQTHHESMRVTGE